MRPVPVTSDRSVHLSKDASDAAAAMAEVVRRAVGGDASALESLLVEAQELTWRFSMAVCGHPEDAEDAMQEALVRTYRHVRQLRDADAFRPWLYRTVRNVCLMARRRRVSEPRHVLSLDEMLPGGGAAPRIDAASSQPTPEDLTSQSRLRRRLKDALAALPAPFRAVVFLRDMEGLSTRETARTLGISEDNVKARLHRARLVLRRELAGQPSASASSPTRRRTAPRRPA